MSAHCRLMIAMSTLTVWIQMDHLAVIVKMDILEMEELETVKVRLEPPNSHGDFRSVVSRGSWPSRRAFARADYANHDWFHCIAWQHRCIEGWTLTVPLRCWKGVHCLSAAWHFRSVHSRLHKNNRCAASVVTRAISQLRTSSERKVSVSATKQPLTAEITLLYVFSLSNSLFFLSFLRLSDQSHMQE